MMLESKFVVLNPGKELKYNQPFFCNDHSSLRVKIVRETI